MRLAKWLIAFAGLFLMANSGLPTNAMNDNNTSDNKQYIALGADLIPEQRSVVLNLMGV